MWRKLLGLKSSFCLPMYGRETHTQCQQQCSAAFRSYLQRDELCLDPDPPPLQVLGLGALVVDFVLQVVDHGLQGTRRILLHSAANDLFVPAYSNSNSRMRPSIVGCISGLEQGCTPGTTSGTHPALTSCLAGRSPSSSSRSHRCAA